MLNPGLFGESFASVHPNIICTTVHNDVTHQSLFDVHCRGDLHEASRRLLSVLLREIDGFNSTVGGRAVVIGATNR